jgi:hypothetical protein
MKSLILEIHLLVGNGAELSDVAILGCTDNELSHIKFTALAGASPFGAAQRLMQAQFMSDFYSSKQPSMQPLRISEHLLSLSQAATSFGQCSSKHSAQQLQVTSRKRATKRNLFIIILFIRKNHNLPLKPHSIYSLKAIYLH